MTTQKKQPTSKDFNHQGVASINQVLGRNKAPGLRKISRQVINTIRASDRALTYKEVSDLVTEKNYQNILDEADKRSPDLSFDSAVTKAKVRNPDDH